MAVNPSFAAKTVAEFIALAKFNFGTINMATAGKASSVHLAGELFMTMTGVKLTVVHYRESYVPGLLAGRMQVVFSPLPHEEAPSSATPPDRLYRCRCKTKSPSALSKSCPAEVTPKNMTTRTTALTMIGRFGALSILARKEKRP